MRTFYRKPDLCPLRQRPAAMVALLRGRHTVAEQRCPAFRLLWVPPEGRADGSTQVRLLFLGEVVDRDAADGL